MSERLVQFRSRAGLRGNPGRISVIEGKVPFMTEQDHEPTVNDSPHPHASLIFGFWNTNLELGKKLKVLNLCQQNIQFDKRHAHLSGSSFQSITLPIIENKALLSISTRTPSCSTTSSNFPGLSTYSRWYDMPAHPLFRTPTRMSWGVGPFNSIRSRVTAVGV